MNHTDFEGYAGIDLNNALYSTDIMLVVILICLFIFSVIFRYNLSEFEKMKNNIITGEYRPALFDKAGQENLLFSIFMPFQTVVLCGIFFTSVSIELQYLPNPDIKTMLLAMASLSAVMLTFYFLKKILYRLFGGVFLEKEAHETMSVNYRSLFNAWGVFMYIPTLSIILISESTIAYILFPAGYLAFRVILICRFINIFLDKNTGIFFLSLYLCAQEIIPLIFLYEGLIYMYNIIETNNIWQ